MVGAYRGHIDLRWNPERQDIGRRLPYLVRELEGVRYEVTTNDVEKGPALQLKMGEKTVTGEKEVREFVEELLRVRG